MALWSRLKLGEMTDAQCRRASEKMDDFVSAVILVLGFAFVVFPRVGAIAPGLDETTASRQDIAHDTWLRVQAAGGASPSGDALRTRVAAVIFILTGLIGLLRHLSAPFVLSVGVITLYGLVLGSAEAKSTLIVTRPGVGVIARRRFAIDNATLCAMAASLGNVALLASMQSDIAHLLAIVVAAGSAVVLGVHAVVRSGAEDGTVDAIVAARWRCAMDYVAIGAANLLAFQYAVVHVRSASAPLRLRRRFRPRLQIERRHVHRAPQRYPQRLQ